MPESSPTLDLLRPSEVSEKLGIEQYQLVETRPCFHYLALGLGKTRSYRFSAVYVMTLLANQRQNPNKRFITLADEFAQTDTARKLVTDTEQAHEKAVEDNLLTLPNGLRVIAGLNIAFLLGVLPQAVQKWAKREETVVPYHDLPPEFTEGQRRNKQFFLEGDFRKIYRWLVPALMLNPPLSYRQLPDSEEPEQIGPDYFRDPNS